MAWITGRVVQVVKLDILSLKTTVHIVYVAITDVSTIASGEAIARQARIATDNKIQTSIVDVKVILRVYVKRVFDAAEKVIL